MSVVIRGRIRSAPVPIGEQTMKLQFPIDAGSGGTTTRDVGGEIIRLGRNPECEVAVDPALFPKVSGIHARIAPAADGFSVVPLSGNNKTLLNDAPVDGASPLGVGDRIQLGFTGPVIEILALQASAPAAASFAQTARPVQLSIRSTTPTSRGCTRARLQPPGGRILRPSRGTPRCSDDPARSGSALRGGSGR